MANIDWKKHYPKGVEHEINYKEYSSLLDFLEQRCSEFKDLTAFENMGMGLSYDDLYIEAKKFAAILQKTCKIKKGDRVAIQMPNLLQYPVALFGTLLSGAIVVNTNPLYTEREMEHQFKDSGAKVLIALDAFAHKIPNILERTSIEHVIITSIPDMLPKWKRPILQFAIKHIKKMVPAYKLPEALSFTKLMKSTSHLEYNPINFGLEDTAFLQYTGGTTGVSKGAILTHKNIIANMLQNLEWMKPGLKEKEETILTPLPLYHIFSLTVNCLTFMSFGAKNILITNPRDLKSYIKTIKKSNATVMTGVNTLFNALLNHPDFDSISWDNFKVSVAGGMALQQSVCKAWKEKTGTNLAEGYGLTEASPVLTCNPIDGTDQVGTIGIPLPSTEIKLIDGEGKTITKTNEPGELVAKGPQIMRGYWNQLTATKDSFTEDGWLKTGDMAIQLDSGFFKVVDRKKDMICVSGFNVYPNEVEDVIADHPKVLEVAAIGIPSERSGEAVKIFVVKKDESLTKEELKSFSKKYLTGYKTPDFIEFKSELPKSNVGKILRRTLREQELENLNNQGLEATAHLGADKQKDNQKEAS